MYKTYYCDFKALYFDKILLLKINFYLVKINQEFFFTKHVNLNWSLTTYNVVLNFNSF